MSKNKGVFMSFRKFAESLGGVRSDLYFAESSEKKTHWLMFDGEPVATIQDVLKVENNLQGTVNNIIETDAQVLIHENGEATVVRGGESKWETISPWE